MNITELKSEGLKKEYKIVIPAQDVESKVDNKLTQISKNIKLPGFRVGKAPKSMLKQKYKASVMGEVLDDMIKDASEEVIKNKELRPAMMPNVKITSFSDGKDVEFEMEEDKNYSGEQFTISPELMAGSARIVLEWGAEPQDLDSYLYGDTDSGADVFVNYYNKQCTDGGDLIAELDVDDTNGYGPETVTLYDLNGVYRYTVVDYRVTGTLQHYGATVKVYLPNQSSPEVITIAPGAGVENIWDVFELDHGELKILNSAGDENRLRESDK